MTPRPVPLRTDGSNAFAHHSMAVRVPGIIRETIEHNPDYPPAVKEALDALAEAISSNTPLVLFKPPAPDYDLWMPYFVPHRGDTWLDTEWFFAEMLAYRLIVEASRYWSTLRDPFAPFKEEERRSQELWDVLEDALEVSGSLEERLLARLTYTLWGNRIDLSLKQVAQQGTHAHDDLLLADDRTRAVAHLLGCAPGAVHLIMDNAGTEQALDFALVDLLLREGLARTVTLHVKMHPVLVSDMIVADVPLMLDAMRTRQGGVGALAGRLQRFLDAGRIRIVPDFFWNTPGRLWALPPRLRRGMEEACLVIAKGDANYRRATNDALWPPEATLARAVDGFPAPLLVLRTLKSDTLVGVEAAVQARLDEAEGDAWRTSGTYAVVQFAP